jgi:hypothetical protein
MVPCKIWLVPENPDVDRLASAWISVSDGDGTLFQRVANGFNTATPVVTHLPLGSLLFRVGTGGFQSQERSIQVYAEPGREQEIRIPVVVQRK